MTVEDLKRKYEEPTAEVEEKAHKNRYSLPFGLCESVGINTENMSPREAWDAYTKKTGKTKEQAEREHWNKTTKKEGKKEKLDLAKDTIEAVNYGIKTKTTKVPLEVPDWIAHKIFVEKTGNPRSWFDTRIYAIVGETEKAYNVILGTPFKHITGWVPKKLVQENKEAFENDQTYVCSFSDAVKLIKHEKTFWS